MPLVEACLQVGNGYAPSAVDPFDCPVDRNVYLDLSFFEELRRRSASRGELAQAFVIACAIGHHIQIITGIEWQPRPRGVIRENSSLPQISPSIRPWAARRRACR